MNTKEWSANDITVETVNRFSVFVSAAMFTRMNYNELSYPHVQNRKNHVAVATEKNVIFFYFCIRSDSHLIL